MKVFVDKAVHEEIVSFYEAAMNHLFPSFLLDKKGPKNQGRHHRSYALGDRSSAMSAVARAPNPVECRRSLSLSVKP